MLLFSINKSCVFINDSVVCKNYSVVFINNTVVYKFYKHKYSFLWAWMQENNSFFVCCFTKFFSYIMWLVFSGGVKNFLRISFKQYLNAVLNCRAECKLRCNVVKYFYFACILRPLY